jgi:hypothetical protein
MTNKTPITICACLAINLLACLTLVLTPASVGQTGSGGKTQTCPTVTPKNSAEALKMETSSNHNGCWVRQADGSLVFVSSQTPNNSYKPLMDGANSPASTLA